MGPYTASRPRRTERHQSTDSSEDKRILHSQARIIKKPIRENGVRAEALFPQNRSAILTSTHLIDSAFTFDAAITVASESRGKNPEARPLRATSPEPQPSVTSIAPKVAPNCLQKCKQQVIPTIVLSFYLLFCYFSMV